MNSGRFEYSERGAARNRRINVKQNAVVVVNGIIQNDGSMPNTASDFTGQTSPFGGTMRAYGTYMFVDNNNDGIYDYIFMTSYVDIHAGDVTPELFRVNDRIWSDVTRFALDNDDARVAFFMRDGSVAKFSDIRRGQVLSMSIGRRDNNGHILWGKVYISEQIRGVITEMGTDEDEDPFVVINEKQYKYFDDVDYPRFSHMQMELGDEGTFAVNLFDRIVNRSLSSTLTGGYAILTRIEDVGWMFESKPKAEMFISSGEWVVLEFAAAVRVLPKGSDEVGTIRNRDIIKLLAGIGLQFVEYRLNDNGEISELNFDKANIGNEPPPIPRNVTLDREYNVPGDDETEAQYNHLTNGMGDSFFTDDTVIFNINAPGATRWQDVVVSRQKDNISVIKMNKDMKNPWMMLYDQNDGNEARAAIGINMVDEEIGSGNMAIVQSISQVMSADGEILTKVYCLQGGLQTAVYIDTETTYAYRVVEPSRPAIGLSIGDVFEYTLSNNNRASKILILLEASKAKGDIRDIYRDKEIEFETVRLYSNNASSVTEEVSFYYGYAARKISGTNWKRLTVYGRNDFFQGILDPEIVRDETRTVAINENTNFYGYYDFLARDRDRVRLTDFEDVTVLSALRYAATDGDLVFVKTVGGIAVDVIVIRL
jgi:hypothetical protein